MIIPVSAKNGSYNIVLQRGAIKNVSLYITDPKAKKLIVTDDGVPSEYVRTVAGDLQNTFVFIFPQGEKSKNFDTYKAICEKLLLEGFTRKDMIIAVGGGVCGDMAGFAAATYMRGIKFYNIPTTLLSQVDSSIGGKTAIDFGGIKNIIGAFYQPECVIIDPDVLSTLPERQIKNGLAESIKMGVTNDESLFELCGRKDYMNNIEKIIEKSLLVKKSVVEEDEKETGLRKVLNFGHTIGHGIESTAGLSELYHGECVALGMLFMCENCIKGKVKKALSEVGLPTEYHYDKEKVFEALIHDKKSSGNTITVVKSKKIGEFYFEDVSLESLKEYL